MRIMVRFCTHEYGIFHLLINKYLASPNDTTQESGDLNTADSHGNLDTMLHGQGSTILADDPDDGLLGDTGELPGDSASAHQLSDEPLMMLGVLCLA